MVVIGVKMDNDEIISILDEALLTEEELKTPENWIHFNDPLPIWQLAD
ncbi:MAG: hypothetical protein Q8M44_06490 [bacterium]|nr:hypothetical protein [bacterium]